MTGPTAVSYTHLDVYKRQTKQGVAKMRSSLAKDIFEQDLLCIYEKQTVQRDELRLNSKELIAEIVSRINAGTYDNPKVEEMLLRLRCV